MSTVLCYQRQAKDKAILKVKDKLASDLLKMVYDNENLDDFLESLIEGSQFSSPTSKSKRSKVPTAVGMAAHARTFGKTVIEGFAQVMIDKASEGPCTSPCPSCGKTIKGELRKRRIETMAGQVEVTRYYFRCKSCAHSFVPTDEALGLNKDVKQDDLQEAMNRLSGEFPFESACDHFERLTGLKYSPMSAHSHVNTVWPDVTPEAVLPTKKEIRKLVEGAAKKQYRKPVLVISTDGAHTPTRPDGPFSPDEKRGPGLFREIKGFRAFLAVKGRIIQIASWHQICTAEELGEVIEILASRIDFSTVRIALVADGAEWIWNQLERHFPKGRKILDFYHCKQYLWAFAKEYFDEEKKQLEWVEATMSRFYYGDAEEVLQTFQEMDVATPDQGRRLNNLIKYFTLHSNKVNYHSARLAGAPIGSGAMESANKQVCHKRLKVSGAYWHVEGANNMLKLRCALLNKTFDRAYAEGRKC